VKLVIISGRSGSGKSTALHVLEDVGYTCIDNLPVGLLNALVDTVMRNGDDAHLAVSVDARNVQKDLHRFPEILMELDRTGVDCEIVYLDAASATLVSRFSETRRRHPLSDRTTNLAEALEREGELLEAIANLADLTLDTTHLTLHQLRDLVKHRVVARSGHGLSLLFSSFAFKKGVPVDADLVFDVRCLPNPHWVAALRTLTGRDDEVIAYLEAQPDVADMLGDIAGFLHRWLPRFEENNRSYMTVAVGCTGGQHRSVYLVERLGALFSESMDNVLVRHRELGGPR
jgi:UPF0042 nucleotide-binding protein